ncbi:DNA cytosine methyltransferase [Starkeya sp. ORNL1]|uniref:DNA cytosine methyltransferase n=1 Tax=Starkeya sp. ORNL1 TaxID=2709380 RepID=UPI001463D279|nr:DNA cytosine methyltransferase [Starkeya sp. ORNL1]QJP14689.1 DNA cytosine methyltransferase [Starkeya sp. ORNL1]
MTGLIIDSFAGGGGASTGIEWALGRSPDIAINHDAEALSMHAVNHPATRHLNSNIWQVDPDEVCAGRPVDLLWASPDCKHHSKAKGGRPLKRSIRDLAWVVVLWAKRARPKVILLENVEEFRDWGPLVQKTDAEGRPVLDAEGNPFMVPCPERRGQTFDRWVSELRRLGYKVEWRELRACDFGAPTVRKRLFLIARRDGRKIVWPKPTHGAPTDPDVIGGRKKPWRTAAEIIDWSLRCPSIFATSAEIKRDFGIAAKRPLAEATMARIAKGVKRYVLDAADPYIVEMHSRSSANRLSEPLRTVSTKATPGLVAPFVTKFHTGATGHDLREPFHTVTANSFIKRPGGAAPFGVVEPVLMPFSSYGQQGGASRPLDAPLHTITASRKDTDQIVAAFLAQHNTDMVGHDAREPVSTIVGKACTQAVVSAGLLNLKGSDRRAADVDAPAPTICAGGGHVAEVRAFLMKYYGVDQDPRLKEPLHTITTRDRFGLVIVPIRGEPFVLADIGMRMLTSRELFRAQGFPDSYIIEHGYDGQPFTGEAQKRMVGNSVSPYMAKALVRANCLGLEDEAPKGRPAARATHAPIMSAPLFDGALA